MRVRAGYCSESNRPSRHRSSSRFAPLRSELFLVAALALACGRDGTPRDGGPDASHVDGGSADAGAPRDGSALTDAATSDAAAVDDAGSVDAGDVDASDVDAGVSDAGVSDAGISSSLDTILTASLYDEFFLHRDDPACEGALFTREALLRAAARFPAFAGTGDDETRRREVAAFLANVSHETTGGWATAPDGPYAWGLCFKEEVGCGGGDCTGYCAPSDDWPCVEGETYHGRGPMQLSWNYNYGQAGDALGLDLLADPGIVARDGELAWLTALWFWMTPQTPKPSCHDVMSGGWTPSASDISLGRLPGFGMSVNIINGGLECGRGADSRVQDRLGFFARYTDLLGVSPGDNQDCGAMTSY